LSTLVGTSVWSLALRRDSPPAIPEIEELRRALAAGAVVATGLVLQELLQGFSKPKAHQQIIERFRAVCGEFQILRKEAVKFQVLSGDP
jgi:hypothetical protein